MLNLGHNIVSQYVPKIFPHFKISDNPLPISNGIPTLPRTNHTSQKSQHTPLSASKPNKANNYNNFWVSHSRAHFKINKVVDRCWVAVVVDHKSRLVFNCMSKVSRRVDEWAVHPTTGTLFDTRLIVGGCDSLLSSVVMANNIACVWLFNSLPPFQKNKINRKTVNSELCYVDRVIVRSVGSDRFGCYDHTNDTRMACYGRKPNNEHAIRTSYRPAWVTDCLAACRRQCINEWTNERSNEWLTEGRKEWHGMNGRV